MKTQAIDPERFRMIVNAARTSFDAFGYKGTTMDQIAKRADVSKGSVYNEFKNKEELFMFILQQMIEEMDRVAEKATIPGLSPEENLQNVLFEMLQFRNDHHLILKLVQEVKEVGTKKAEEGLSFLEEQTVSLIQKRVERLLEQNLIKPCDTKLTAFIMFKMYTALVSDWEERREPLSRDEIAASFRLYMLDGLKK
ncbi:TetR/AcrR family transcriptional regulator [Salsuginibacillus kocurii]|uniref:TetR/AcrR family transcriptional regulator n=1 Tax=Salsuginibacillus kocurii TaxID=427078 RepID=UPI00037C38DA|nr:TetR/AcrR family transcriptional regulator [Salsuginibacillus kocurii]